MVLSNVASSVQLGRTVTFKARGKSMEPRVKDQSIVSVRPLGEDEEVRKRDVVLARVNGRWYLHLVTAVRHGQVQISNNHGHVNGWTARTNVIGVLKDT